MAHQPVRRDPAPKPVDCRVRAARAAQKNSWAKALIWVLALSGVLGAGKSAYGACPTITLSPTTLSSATVGSSYSVDINASNGSLPHTFSISSGSLPAGLTLNTTTGVISGIPTSAGSSTFTVRARDQAGCTGTRSYTLTRSCPTITISPDTLEKGKIGVAYSDKVSATGNGSLTFSVSNGTLPLGLSLNASTGVISGTPTASYPSGQSFKIRASSPYNCTATKNYSLRICPNITLGTLANGTAGSNYSATVTASGGRSPYVYSVASGSLPTGLSLSTSNGKLTGLLKTSEPTTFTIQAVDKDTCVGTRTYTITPACPNMSISTSSIPAGNVGALYLQQFSGSGGTSPRTFSVTSGSLPAGIGLTSDGYIWGWPTEAVGAQFTLTMTDAYGCSVSRNYTFNVCANISVGSTLPAAGANTDYSEQLAAIGGVGPYTFALTSGSLPPGMSLAANGTVSGRCLTMGNYSFSVSVTDANGCSGSGTVSLRVDCPVLEITPAGGALPNFTIGSSYSQALSVSPQSGLVAQYFSGKDFSNLLLTRKESSIDYDWGSDSPHPSVPAEDFCVRWTGDIKIGTGGDYTLSVTADDGIRLWFDGFLVIDQWKDQSATTYTVSGKLDANSTHSIKVEYYERGGSAVARVRWSGPGISLSPITAWKEDVWSLAGGSLPSGLSLNTTTGVISGTPQAGATNSSFSVRVTNADGCTAIQNYTLAPNCTPMTVGPATLPAATIGVPYSRQATVTGGTGPFTYSIDSGSLPAGLTMNASGAVAGTPTTAGTSSFKIKVVDVNNCAVVSASYSITTTCPAVVLSPTVLPGGTVGTAYSQTATATGGNGGYTYSLSGGTTLPAGLTLNASTGAIAGIPTATGTSVFTVRVVDGFGCAGMRSYSVTVVCPTISIDTASLPVGTAGSSYSQQLTASGGSTPRTFTLAGGTLPSGMTLSAQGLLGGTPSAGNGAGSTITIRVTDAYGCTTTKDFSLKICPAILVGPGTLPGAVVGSSYSQSVTASGSVAPYSWTISSGALPTGLTLNGATGGISGTVTAAGTYNFTLRAADASGCVGTQAYTVTMTCPSVTLTPTLLPAGTVGTNYSQVVAASGGNGNYTYSISSGTLPAGLSLDATSGAISGTPTSANGSGAAIVVRAVDKYGCAGTRSYSLKICPVVGLGPTTLPNPVIGSAYSQPITATNGAAPYTYTVTQGSLPPGLALNSSTGTLAGTPSSLGESAFTIRAVDANGCVGTYSYNVETVCPAITLSSATLPSAVMGTAYSASVSASGGVGSYVYSITGGTLPAGLTFNSASGAISGTPTASNGAGVLVTVTATDVNGCKGSKEYRILVCPVIAVGPATLPGGTVGTPYSSGATASGGASPYTYAISSGTLPPGVALNPVSGAITGTPTAAGTSTFTVLARDANGCTGTSSYSVINVCPAVTVSPATLPAGAQGTAYSQTVSATGGNGAYTFSISAGTLPAGLTLNSSTGKIAGTPTAGNGAGATITVSAVDAYGCTGVRTYTLKICPQINIGPSTLPNGTLGTAYSQSVAATGGVAPYTYSVSTGTLPTGITLNESTGALSGLPIVESTGTFTVRATDANGCTATRAYSVSMVCPAIVLNPESINSGNVGVQYSQTITTTGGTAPKTFAITSGTLPAGLSLNSDTGVIAGTPSSGNGAGTSITVQVTDALGCGGSKTYTLKICPNITLSSTPLAAATVGSTYTSGVSASGGATPYAYEVISGTLTPGVLLNAATGALTGTPTAAGSAIFAVKVTDANGCSATRAYTLTSACPTLTLSPATLALGAQGIAYSQSLSAGGGKAPYTYNISAGTLPAGLGLSSGGLISGTPAVGSAGSVDITVTVTDGYGCTATRDYELLICPTIAIAPATLPFTQVGTSFSQMMTGSGGTAPYSYSISSGALPEGFTLNPTTGEISGTSSSAAGGSFTVRAVDAKGCAGTRSYTMTIGCPAMSITTASVASGTVNKSYSQTIAATGGTAPRTFSVSAGALPSGLTLNASTGAITGTPTGGNGAGVTVGIKVTDAYNCTATKDFTFKICPVVTLSPTTLASATVNTSYSQAVTASGGVEPYVYAISGGSLPAGLTLNSSAGLISGTPTSSSAASFIVRATDATGCTGTRSYTITPSCAAVVVTPGTPAKAVQGTFYSQQFTGTGGIAPYTWEVASGSLPAGLSLATATGVVSGTPTSANGSGSSVMLRATDVNGCQGTQTVVLQVCPVVGLTPTSLSSGTAGTAYSQALTAAGGVAPYNYTLASGTLPSGLTLNAGGVISGTPTTSTGTVSFSVRAVDANGCAGTRNYSMSVALPTSDFGDYSEFASASSTANSTLFIGSSAPDTEASAITDAAATGDDLSGTDDEDGISFSTLTQGASGTATVKVTNNRGATSYLNLWIDWNNNGSLTDAGEQVATNLAITTGTTNSNRSISFTVPSNANPGTVGVRARLTSVSNPGPTGSAGSGEVEDTTVMIERSTPPFAILVVNYNNNTISRFNGANGAHLATWSPSGLSQPNYGYRISDNTFLVANGASNTITKYNPFTGAYTGTVVSSGKGLNFPYQMAVNLDGSVYIANQNADNVLRFNPSTGAVLGTVLSTNSPAGLVFDTAGTMYITQNQSGGTLRNYSTNGTLLSTVTTWPSGESPRGLAWGPDGRLYVNVRNGNAATGRVDAITFPAGTRSTFVNLDSGSNPYTGIKWGPDGNLYVVDYGESELHVFTAAGTLLRTITTSLNGPHAVAFTDLTASTTDFGDYSGFGDASSTWSSTVRLGIECDTEYATRGTALANGDDIDDSDDEDGVIMPATLTAGTTATIPVKLLNTSNSTVYLSAWIDFNRNGSISDNGEKVISNRAVPTGTNGTQNISIAVPAGISNVIGGMVGGVSAVTPGEAGVRFRISSLTNVPPTGAHGVGEVEDYMVTLVTQPLDHGDDLTLGSASSMANSKLRIGTAATDTETSSPANNGATGDDSTGTDDEDSTMPVFRAGSSSTLTLSLFNNTGANAYLAGWIDWNGDGLLTGAGEAVIPETTVASSASAQSRNFTITVPSTAERSKPISVRLRLSSAPSIPSVGIYGFGEVEDYKITVQCANVTLLPATLANGTIGSPYSQTVTANGGAAPYTYTVTGGTFPAWADLDETTGDIRGTPTSGGSSSFTISATDASGCVGTANYTISPACPAVAVFTSALPVATVGVNYEQTLAATGGKAPYTWALTQGTMPAGLTLNTSTGVITGTPTAGNGNGTTLTFRVTDANGCQGSRPLSLRVCPVIQLSPATLVQPVLGVSYSQTITSSGGASPSVFTVSSGSLPAGLSLSASSGQITGIPTSSATATFSIRVTDPNGCQGERFYSMAPGCPAISVTPVTLANGVVGSSYSQTLVASAGTAPFAFEVTGGSLPAGLSLNPTTGALTGTPTSSTSATFTVKITGSYGCQATRTYTVTPACPAITITPDSLNLGKINTSYSQALSVDGGTGPYVWTVASGALPAGLTLNSNTGVISGTPTLSNGAGASVTLRATDSTGCFGQVSATLVVCPVVTVSPATLPNGTSGTAYSQNVSATGGQGPYTFTVVSGDLPDGLSLSSSGAITGTPDTQNSGTFTVRATDANGCAGEMTYTVTAGCPTITVTPATLAGGVVGSPYSQQLTASPGGEGTYTWSVSSGSLPAGLTLNSATGAISGTPKAAGSTNVTFRATHANGCFSSNVRSIVVSCPTMTVTPSSLANPVVNVAYHQALTVTGNTTPVTWSIASGSLPGGLSLSEDGIISGTPSGGGSASFSVKATDANGCQVSKSYNLSTRSLGIGNLVWVDTNNDGIRQSSESGVPGLTVELWSVGTNGVRENGAGDDVKAAADVMTDSSGLYGFSALAAGSYYVRIPATPVHYPDVSTLADAADNGEDNDSNGLQPGGSGTAVVSPVIALAAGTEPDAGVDGDNTDTDSTIDIGFANKDGCYVTNLIDNPSFEFQQMPNSTGTLKSLLNYNGSGTSFGAGFNGLQWVGGTNGTAALNAPIQRVQVAASTAGSKVSWVESLKARHGRRMLVLEGSNSAITVRAAGGGNWSTALVPGHEYQLSVWAASASSAAASLTWDLAASNQIFQVITGATPGLYDHYTVPQGEMVATEPGEQQCCGSTATGTSFGAFGSADYNNWSESVSNAEKPQWRQFTWRFRVIASATTSQVDTTVITLSGGSGTGPIAVDHVGLCRVAPTNTMTLGNQIWNDVNNNGVRDGSELGVGGVTVQLYSTENNVAGDSDDVLLGTTSSSAAGVYNFTSLAAGKYVVKVTPPANLPATGGTPVTLDNGVNNDNNGSQPGGVGTPLYSPVVNLAFGTESTSDGDSDTDTDLSIDFGLFSGFQVGNLVWADLNNDGVFQSGTESGIPGVTVQLLHGGTGTVLATTTTNSSGVYSFTAYAPGTYRVRIPTPPAAYPLITAVNDPSDNGEDNDSNGSQPGGVGTAVTSPLFSLTAASEPGLTGTTNVENTIDFGFRTCPVLSISPGTLSAATQYSAYSLNLSATGGTGPYSFVVSSGALPAGMSLSSSGAIGGTPNASALPGQNYLFTVRATDSTGCSATRSFSLSLLSPAVAVNPATLPSAAQYAAYSQLLGATGGTAPYTWSVSPSLGAGAVSWWLGENGPGDALAANHGIMYNGVTYGAGTVGNAFVFDGIDDRIEAADSASLRPAAITLEAWVKPDAGGVPVNGVVATKTTGTTGTDGYGLGQLGNGNDFGFWVNDRANNRVTATLTPGVWSHVVASYDGSSMKLYVNGGLVTSRAYSGPIAHSSTPLLIGNNGGGTYAWKGAVDELVLYNRALSPAEIVARHQYTVSGNNGMPTGLTIDSSTGVISGTPTSFPASYSFYARASDANGSPGIRSYTLVVSCPFIAITPTSLPAAKQYAAYAGETLQASGGTGPYVWSVFSGSLPDGMTLSSGGALSGTPGSLAGNYSFTVQARDANNCTATRTYTLSVQCPTITLSATTFSNAAQFVPYSAQTITASGGNEPYVFSIESGSLPTGMSLSSGGSVSGTPTAVPGTYPVTIRAKDASDCTGTRSYNIVVTCASIAITPATLPAVSKFSAYSQTLTASNGNGSYTWSVSAGALPSGLSMNSAGLISGTATAAPGTYNFTAKVTDAQNCTATRPYALTVNCPAATIMPATLPSGAVIDLYSQQLSVNGGASSYTWSVQSGSLPVGILLSPTGLLTGTTLFPGNYSFVARALDADNCVVTRSYNLSVATNCPPITIAPTNVPGGQTKVAYSQQLTATGGVGPYTWVRTSGSLPTGITLSADGLLSGIPTAGPGNYNFTVQATDNSPSQCTGSQSFTLTLTCPTVVITPASLNSATVGTTFTQSLSASGGTAPYTYSVASGSLPAGLSLSGTGLISGTPTAATTASFTVEVRDAFNCSATIDYTLTASCPSMEVAPASLPPAYKETAYSQTLSVNAGTGPFVWSVVSGAPPAGLSLSSAGVLSGTPTNFGSSNFTVRVTDTYGCSTTKEYGLSVKGLTLGDLVYEDANFNGTRDAGENGAAGVTVQLWDPGADHAIGGTGPNADVQIGANFITTSSGAYSFANLVPGYYFVKILPTAALPIPGANPVNVDNGVNNDNNSATQPGGPGTAIFSPVVQLTSGGEPTSEDSDADTDLTLDFGLFRGMAIGNLVWQDTDDDGIKDDTEPGVAGVTLELWSAGADSMIGGADDVRVRTTTSSAAGAYSFTELAPGKYYVRIPTPPASHPLSSSVSILTDNGVDNDDNGHQVAAGAIYSAVITLAPGQEPGTSGSTYTDNTIDFGLCNITPKVYVSATQDDSIQTFDASTGAFTGVLHHPFGNSHSQGNGDPFDVPYGMELGPDGKWYVAHFGESNLRRITAAGVDQGAVLDNSAANVSLIMHFVIGADGNFYVVDENGNRVVRFHGPLSATPGAPMGTAPYTFISQTGIQDLNVGPDGNLYAVVHTGSTHDIRRYSASTGELLNIIVNDVQITNLVAGGQPVSIISGIDIHGNTLYGVNKTDGEVFRIDLSDPAAPGLPQLVASLASAGMGTVDTRDLEVNPADGKLYITGYNWGKPVIGGTYASGALLRVDPAGAPNGTTEFFEVPIPTPPGPNNEIWSGPRDIAFGRPFSSLTASVSIGSLVWNDENANGIHDAGEVGIPGVRVELWRDVDGNAGNGAESLIGWTFTDGRGMYYFSGEPAGRYQVKVPTINFEDGMPLSRSGYSSPITVTSDNGVDGDDNGAQTGGVRTEVVSPLITLAVGTEPTGDGVSGAEIGPGGELDNYTVDANGDMTVDFGFVEPGRMGIGNLVFLDANGNRRYDLGEGIDDVIVQLYYWGQTPGEDQPVASTVTASGGKYLFTNLWQGQYFVHLPASQFQVTGILRGLFSLEGVQAGDDNLGEDSLDTASPFDTGLSTGRIILTRDSTPTNADTETGVDANQDDADDANIDLTIDIGMFRPVALGNLVFDDVNSNGRADDGEGVDNILVQLYTFDQEPGIDPPVATTYTSGGGRYLFDSVRPGHYIVFIPPSMFAPGAPLYQRVSISEGLAGDDDVGENGLNDTVPATEGVRTSIVSLFPGSTPTDDTGESGVGSTDDNQNDASTDLTIDFGFQMPVGVGNMVFVDANGNGIAESGEGVDGVTVELYRADQIPGVSEPLFNRVTSGGGRYLFDFLPSGNYIVYIPASEFGPGKPLGLSVSMNGAQTDNSDDDQGEDGIDQENPFITGIASRVITLTVDGCPVSTDTETGLYNDSDSFDDNNFDLTVDFGFEPANPNAVGLGNLVYRDINGNGLYDAGEGVDGVNVQLFNALADPQSTTPLASTVTTGGGIYLFSNLTAGNYVVHIPASEFGTGGPLEGWTSLPGSGGDIGRDDDADENGIDSQNAAQEGISSDRISLEPGTEPLNVSGEFGRDAFMDDSNDGNTDLTVDFGFFKSVSVGNLVFLDANYNGRADEGEGLEGVEVQLFAEGMSPLFDLPLATVFSDVDGHYLFENLNPGNYFLHVSYQQFMPGSVLYHHASVAGTVAGDDHLGEDGLDDGKPEFNGISTAVFTLTPTNAPTGAAEAGFEGDSDDLNDASSDLTRDLGFVPRMVIGNLVFRDSNNDGFFDANTEFGIDGVTVELWSNSVSATAPLATMQTNSGGRYSFSIAPGAYQIRVPASDFAVGGVLENLVPPRATPNAGGVFVDDDGGQDAYAPNGQPVANGARTAFFTVLPGLAPTSDNGETGFLSFEDDSYDTESDLSVDLGFAPKPLSVGNLVFADVNSDGRFTTGTDFPVPNVLVQLFEVGADPATSTPLAQAYSNENGIYELFAPAPGEYFVHVPASNFAGGAPLASAAPAPGFGSDDGLDDDVNEDTLNASSPASTGVNSIVFELSYGSEPTASETGYLGGNDNNLDADKDLTIDLGFTGVATPPNLGIGNLVFADANGNGVYDSGEGVSGVWMLLFHQGATPGIDPPLRSTFTDDAGRYLFTYLRAGSYVVHVAADNFKPNISLNGSALGDGPLYGRLSLTGSQSTASSLDDNLGEDGIDETLPLKFGISSGSIALAAGTAPSGGQESGFDGSSDNAHDSNYNLTIDFGFNATEGSGGDELPDSGAGAASYAEWSSTQANGGAPNDDLDHDGATNLFEYAVGTPADSAMQGAPRVSLEANAQTGVLDAIIIRPEGGRSDVTYDLQVLADLRQAPAGWVACGEQPVVVANGDGTETMRYADILADPQFAGSAQGFVRLKVTLAGGGLSAVSPVQGWINRDLAAGQQTVSMSLLAASVFKGQIAEVTGSVLALTAASDVEDVLQPGGEYYAEVLDGAYEGHRFEIDEAASAGANVALDFGSTLSTLTSAPTNLAGARIAIRRHWTVDALFPAASFTAGTSAADADRVQFLDSGSQTFFSAWLSSTDGWTGEIDGSYIVAPGEGLFVGTRSSINLTYTGEVRANDFVQPLSSAAQLIGNGYPVVASPASLGLTLANGFTAGLVSAESDKIRIWRGDSTPYAVTYRNFYYRGSAQDAKWVDEGAVAVDVSAEDLFHPGHALIVAPQLAKPDRRVTCPWAP